MNNGKYKYLLKNIGLLTISNFGTKILSFIMIPLYTNLLTTVEYGTYDVYSTTISLIIPILTINIIDSVLRFCLDKDKDNSEVFTIGLKYIIRASIIFIILVILNNLFNLFTIFKQFYIYLILLFVSDLFYSLIFQFSHGIERVKDVAIASVINSITMLGLNLLLLLYLNKGIKGYFIANIVSYIIPSIYLGLRVKIWKYVKMEFSNKNLKKQMILYSKPLIFNTISWWINNVSDRYIVTWLCGLAENGVYSVAYKIPSILNIVQSIFSQAWTLSAVKEYKNDSQSFYTSIYKIYNCGMVLVCTFLILFDKIIAKILFAKDFYMAWRYAPFLMISIVFGALSGMLGGIFSAAKKSNIFAKTTMIGAVINTILNILLVYFMGVIGAAIATMIAYIVVWIARIIETNKIVKLNINLKRDIISYVLLVLQTIIYIIDFNEILIYIVVGIISIIILFIYKNDYIEILKKIQGGKKCLKN